MVSRLAIKSSIVIALVGILHAEPVKWETLMLVDGKVYKNVTMLKKKADGISILHATGAAGIPYEQLPIAIQNELGGFDPEAAERFRNADSNKQRKIQAALRDREVNAEAARKAKELKEEQEQAELNNARMEREPAAGKRVRPGGIKISARTVSWKTKRSSYSAVWSRVNSSEAEILAYAERNKDSYRELGINLRCGLSSRGGEYVVEVFWFGFPLADKRKRYICAWAADRVEVLPRQSPSINANSHYNYKDAALVYLRSDSPFNEWEGLYIRSWSGYTYAGWAVRVSDGFGNVMAMQGAQPSFLKHLKGVPVPRIKD